MDIQGERLQMQQIREENIHFCLVSNQKKHKFNVILPSASSLTMTVTITFDYDEPCIIIERQIKISVKQNILHLLIKNFILILQILNFMKPQEQTNSQKVESRELHHSSEYLSQQVQMKLGCLQNQDMLIQGQNNNIENYKFSIVQEKDSQNKIKARTRVRTQYWHQHQIKKIFQLYNQFGSQWRIIQSEIEDRSANSIKNRFYTVVRTMLKLLFKFQSNLPSKLPNEIPSKVVLRFYEGRQQFNKFRGLGKRILKQINYNIQSSQWEEISNLYQRQVVDLYAIIFKSSNRQSYAKRQTQTQINENEEKDEKIIQKIEQLGEQKGQIKIEMKNYENGDEKIGTDRPALESEMNNIWFYMPIQEWRMYSTPGSLPLFFYY